ncbi:MAG: biotin--[acetyl-CoA-carboxylase] ligase [Proteobacteria bacterium]|nr:biotin--[acetyl-CoA-carboxylase] ligase [Pseudomonadota bacterium]
MADNKPTPEAVVQRLRRELSLQHAGVEYDLTEIVRRGAFVGSSIESHDQLPRAMDHARSLIAACAGTGRSMVSGTVILADEMSRCKGRFARSWHAPRGGVWGCMVFANTLLPQWRSFIPLAAGVACCDAVNEIFGVASSVRWVNDVLVEGKKLAGFLVESYTEPVHREEFALVGFGININNTSFPAELKATATSIAQILGRSMDLAEFTTAFLAKLALNFGILLYEEARDLRGDGFSGRQGLHLLLDRWLRLSDTLGKRVIFGFDVMNVPQYEAEVIGLDRSGGLILRLADGSVKTEYSGEIRYLG